MSESPISPAKARQLTKDCAIGLSLANLLMLRVWSALLTKNADAGYTLSHPPRPVDFAAAILGVSLLGLFFSVVSTIARRSTQGRVVLQWGAVLSIGLVINAVRQVVTNSPTGNLGAALRDGDWRTAAAAGLVGACLLVTATLVWRDRVARIVSIALLVSSPFALVTFSEAAIGIARYNPSAYANKALAPPVQAQSAQRRILWVIFDEMDERLAFVNRDPALRLPEFERLGRESFTASDARSPDRTTLKSLPSLLTGEQVINAQTVAPNDLLLTYRSGRTAHWQDEPNLFSAPVKPVSIARLRVGITHTDGCLPVA